MKSESILARESSLLAFTGRFGSLRVLTPVKIAGREVADCAIRRGVLLDGAGARIGSVTFDAKSITIVDHHGIACLRLDRLGRSNSVCHIEHPVHRGPAWETYLATLGAGPGAAAATGTVPYRTMRASTGAPAPTPASSAAGQPQPPLPSTVPIPVKIGNARVYLVLGIVMAGIIAALSGVIFSLRPGPTTDASKQFEVERSRVECPAGTSWNGSVCVSLCPAGSAWNGRACAATVVECPAGATWNGSACEGPRLAMVSQSTDSDRGRGAGESRRDALGLTWVWMPSGSFRLGCEPQDRSCDGDEKPGRERKVEGFWMAQNETTVAAYQECVRVHACTASDDDTAEKTCNAAHKRSQHPMNCVDWDGAGSFCRWVGGRLPTAAEWEYAAKSGSSRVYPWGNDPVTGRRANFCDSNCPTALSETSKKMWQDNGWVTLGEDDGWAAIAPVGSFGSGDTPWGLKDMAGNVSEWTASDYDSNSKELRGGSWSGTPAVLRASRRDGFDPAGRDDRYGFRCAQ